MLRDSSKGPCATTSAAGIRRFMLILLIRMGDMIEEMLLDSDWEIVWVESLDDVMLDCLIDRHLSGFQIQEAKQMPPRSVCPTIKMCSRHPQKTVNPTFWNVNVLMWFCIRLEISLLVSMGKKPCIPHSEGKLSWTDWLCKTPLSLEQSIPLSICFRFLIVTILVLANTAPTPPWKPLGVLLQMFVLRMSAAHKLTIV